MFAGLAMVTGGAAAEDLHGEPGHTRLQRSTTTTA